MASKWFVVFLAVLPVCVYGDPCISPEVTYNTYTTTDSAITTDTVFLVEFSMKCHNGVTDINVYADLNDKTVPASRIEGTDKYQVSWSDDHKSLPAGTYTIRFYDEENYSDLRKAQRSAEDTSKIKTLFVVEVNHPGASKGFMLQSEFVAAGVAIIVWYLAYNARSKIQG